MKIVLSPQAPVRLGAATTERDLLETAFLVEMLKIAMPDTSNGAFGGGVGESQFASFLTERRAEALAARLDLGLDLRGARHA